ncbi:hypothetical protein HWV62_43507 [Athelia sp. TMB]|nr:hypothetical protein HWV62_43507 [Athelia sp. TMB]
MSTPFTSFARALSPAANAIVGSINSDAEAARIARHTLLQGASTVEELIALVPSDYRHVLRTPLLGVAATATKLQAARTTHSKWTAHKTAGTYPPHLRAKAPEVQLTKDFAESEEAVQHRTSLSRAYDKFLADSLDKCIQAKADDVKFLEMSLTPERLYQEMSPAITARGEELIKKSRLPKFENNAEGQLVLSGWEDNSVAIELAKQVLADAVVYAFRVISTVEAREYAVKSKLLAKKNLAAAADVDMADGSKPGPSIQSLVDKAVSAQLKKISSGSKKKDAGANKKKTSSTSKDAKRPPAVTPYVPKAGRKPPKATKGAKTSKGGKGKGKGKARK